MPCVPNSSHLPDRGSGRGRSGVDRPVRLRCGADRARASRRRRSRPACAGRARPAGARHRGDRARDRGVAPRRTDARCLEPVAAGPCDLARPAAPGVARDRRVVDFRRAGHARRRHHHRRAGRAGTIASFILPRAAGKGDHPAQQGGGRGPPRNVCTSFCTFLNRRMPPPPCFAWSSSPAPPPWRLNFELLTSAFASPLLLCGHADRLQQTLRRPLPLHAGWLAEPHPRRFRFSQGTCIPWAGSTPTRKGCSF